MRDRQGGRIVTSPIIKTLAAALVSLFIFSGTTQAQNAGRVAILDVAKVFKMNPTFEAKMKAIREEADTLKASITARQEKIRDAARGLSEFGVGTPERNNMEADLEQQQTRLRTEARQAEMTLLSREAKIYYETYIEMQSVVETIASEYGLSLVLRFDSEEIDPSNRTEVIKGVNRSVVFHRKVDLTNMVTKELNQRMAQRGGAINR